MKKRTVIFVFFILCILFTSGCTGYNYRPSYPYHTGPLIAKKLPEIKDTMDLKIP